jgi:hypothetical protein
VAVHDMHVQHLVIAAVGNEELQELFCWIRSKVLCKCLPCSDCWCDDRQLQAEIVD